MVPTRELAKQVCGNANDLFINYKCAVCIPCPGDFLCVVRTSFFKGSTSSLYSK